MAVDITITFTDSQWDLVNKHYPNFIENEVGALVHQDITAEILKKKLFDGIKADVSECLMNSARAEASQKLENCFDV